MRIARNIIDTLKMELGLINIKQTNLIKKPDIFNIQVDYSVSLFKISLSCPKVLDSSLKNSVTIHENFQITGSNIRIKSGIFQNESFILNDSSLKIQESDLKSLPKIEEEVTIFSKKINLNPGLKERKIKFQTRILSNSALPPLLIIVFHPEKFVDRSKVIKATQKILNSAGSRNIKFLGFYKNIPVGFSKRIIYSNGKLIVFLNNKGLDIFKDVFAFKVNGKFHVEVL
ncbi:hypothetical protein JYK00_09010 [Thermosipho ferrireducens]|uniref:Uncharacterized protein n=1 Tax=Thermosipho ferrireducens TaxID=2571116 RepID=A0ABX7S899_9BACT|nr:hypothetical protein [Thermosipho ferrireducens]QTA37847.1 hypothetical protein JYK00_09010 [Thermosipho ferrireducens]